jgi:hypothetical protein
MAAAQEFKYCIVSARCGLCRDEIDDGEVVVVGAYLPSRARFHTSGQARTWLTQLISHQPDMPTTFLRNLLCERRRALPTASSTTNVRSACVAVSATPTKTHQAQERLCLAPKRCLATTSNASVSAALFSRPPISPTRHTSLSPRPRKTGGVKMLCDPTRLGLVGSRSCSHCSTSLPSCGSRLPGWWSASGRLPPCPGSC